MKAKIHSQSKALPAEALTSFPGNPDPLKDPKNGTLEKGFIGVYIGVYRV